MQEQFSLLQNYFNHFLFCKRFFTYLKKKSKYVIVSISSRRGGMVDTLDSKSNAGDCVRVQVSSPATKRPNQDFFNSKLF